MTTPHLRFSLVSCIAVTRELYGLSNVLKYDIGTMISGINEWNIEELRRSIEDVSVPLRIW